MVYDIKNANIQKNYSLPSQYLKTIRLQSAVCIEAWKRHFCLLRIETW